MTTPATDDSDAFLAAFLQQRLADQRDGIERSLDDYCRRFPRHAESIRAAWRECDPQAPSASAAAPFATIGPYVLHRRLGQGGQGEVWLGEDTRLQRRVAVKLLRHVVFATADGLERFRREAQVASRLEHPGICAVYDVGFEAGMPYLVMRYLDGQPLAAAIPALVPGAGSDRPARLLRIATIVERLARALHEAHEAGVLHRDIKPQNVMLTAGDQPVLLDFGLARLADDDTLFTRSGDRLGTPAYLPPEQLADRPAAPDRAGDVYGLGVVLFECLTGRRPFEAPTIDALYRQIADGRAPAAHRCNGAVPRELAILAGVAMEREPRRRYESAAAFADDLQRWRERRPILARPAGPWLRASRWAQRSPALAFACLALLVTLAIGLGVSLALGQRANRLLGEWERLADRRRLDELVREADAMLWPAVPAKVPAMQAWLQRAEALLRRLPDHREALAGLQAPAAGGEGDDERAWRRAQLEDLVRGLDAFAAADPFAPSVASVRDRLAWAEQLTARTLVEPAAAWHTAAARVAAAKAYARFALTPQLGLVPLGPDPESGLEEFADPRTGTVPVRGADGALQRDENTAVVFVLLPGGAFRMGAQNHDPDAPHYDKGAWAIEGPPHLVTLAPFLLSKFELTQAQWLATMGDNPSEAQPGTPDRGGTTTLANAVENVDWVRCTTLASHLGWTLPTEAQWEYACRAGSATRWSCGDDAVALADYANFGDEASRGDYMPGWPYQPDSDDGHSRVTAVGSYRPNAFGLFDMHGNVAEWCLDAMLSYEWDVKPGTGERIAEERPPGDAERRAAVRGGNCVLTLAKQRSSYRNEQGVHGRSAHLGLRPARLLSP